MFNIFLRFVICVLIWFRKITRLVHLRLIIAISEGAQEAIWLHHLYGELGFIQKEPIIILGDNDGSIAMAHNPQFHKRTKHVDIWWHWVRELVSNGLINIVDCHDPQQTVDILTHWGFQYLNEFDIYLELIIGYLKYTIS